MRKLIGGRRVQQGDSLLKILSIKKKPRWKFWKVDNIEVEARFDSKHYKVSIFSTENMDFLVLHYIINKIRGLNQYSHKYWKEDNEKLSPQLSISGIGHNNILPGNVYKV